MDMKLGAHVAVILLLLIIAEGVPIPEYVRGQDYKWVLPRRDRANGLSYLGANERLRTAMDRLRRGETIKITTLGGSITAGAGSKHGSPSWPKYLFNFMQDTYGADRVEGHNGAVAGTLSAYMSVCHNMHVPKDTDIIFLEYSINDWHALQPYYMNNQRKAFERLLRKLLKYPKRPAVVLLHAYVWLQSYPHEGAFWNNAEREFSEFVLYYHLPSLSLKSAVYDKMVAGQEGFIILPNREYDDQGMANKSFYWDTIHPDGLTGARVMAELAMHLLQTTYNELSTQPITAEDKLFTDAELPRPMIPKNFESTSDKCFIGARFTATVQSHEGWEWINESKTNLPKWGYVTYTPEAVLRLLIDTRASAPATHHPLAAGATRGPEPQASPDDVLVELAYLRSYQHMGRAWVVCKEQCSCARTEIEGHQEQRNSQLHLHNFYVTQAERCIIEVIVQKDTSSGENKVKIAGVMISEQAGEHDGIRNNGAVEYVGDISQSTKAKNGTFDVENIA